MSSKPPLGGRVGALCTAELGVDDPIVAKVVFLGHRSGPRGLKVTAGAQATVNVQRPCIVLLPERCREMESSISPDVDVVNLLARASTHKIKNVKVFEVASEVVSEIDAEGRVVACCSPVGRVSLKGFSSDQIQAVYIPVQEILVQWCVVLERKTAKRVKHAIGNTP